MVLKGELKTPEDEERIKEGWRKGRWIKTLLAGELRWKKGSIARGLDAKMKTC